jgi:hypothetical protein
MISLINAGNDQSKMQAFFTRKYQNSLIKAANKKAVILSLKLQFQIYSH